MKAQSDHDYPTIPCTVEQHSSWIHLSINSLDQSLLWSYCLLKYWQNTNEVVCVTVNVSRSAALSSHRDVLTWPRSAYMWGPVSSATSAIPAALAMGPGVKTYSGKQLYIYIYVCMEVSINGVTPPNGWFIMENPINKLRIWGYLHFRKPPYEYMYVNGRWTIPPSHNQNIVMYTYTFTSLFLARHSSKGGELSWMATLNISVWRSRSI